ncbi:MAG: TRAP transporter large permease [Burkholderiales bacterium]
MSLVTYLLLGLLLVLVFAGVEIAVCLGIISFLALYLSTGDLDMTMSFLSSTAYEALRDYVFAVIPLFLLMGEFIARSGIASDLFWAIDNGMRRIAGRLAYATIAGNVVFGFVTGTSVASATTFTSIAYPQMKRFGYDRPFSLGLIAGSACLGMLIPPSILMVVWGILTEQSIGHLFLAGIFPGLILAALMAVHVLVVYLVRPQWLGEGTNLSKESIDDKAMGRAILGGREAPTPGQLVFSLIGFFAIIMGALGGIWVGLFTPTEGAGIGALIALVISLIKGMRWEGIKESVLATGRTATPLLVIVFSAQLYSRTLSMSGIGLTLQTGMLESGLPGWGIVLFMIFVWFVLGMLIDSISIMLLTVPIFAPVAAKLGLDPLVFAMVGILVIEAGLLTPPFGIIVYAVKATVGDEDVSMGKIFMASTPFWMYLLLINILLFTFPAIATFLPRSM